MVRDFVWSSRLEDGDMKNWMNTTKCVQKSERIGVRSGVIGDLAEGDREDHPARLGHNKP